MLKNKKGMTLAEMLVAVSLLVIVSTIYMSLYFSGHNANIRAKQRLDAVIQGQNAIEQLKSQESLTEGTTEINIANTIVYQTITEEESTSDGTLYNITIEISTKAVGDIIIATKLYKPNNGGTP